MQQEILVKDDGRCIIFYYLNEDSREPEEESDQKEPDS